MKCHKCKYNGCKSDACLSCEMPEEYSYKYQQYIFDTYDAPEPDKEQEVKVTDLDEEAEDKFRKMLYRLFDLEPLELLVLQSIMRGESLTEYANKINHIITKLSKNKDLMTRFHAFQLRASIAKKIPNITQALITTDQRKELKQSKLKRTAGKSSQ